ncbi:MAG: DNA methyltransferase, partial [Panacagrimonas sp.]
LNAGEWFRRVLLLMSAPDTRRIIASSSRKSTYRTVQIPGASSLLKKKGGQKGGTLDPINDYILWAVKDKERATSRINKLFVQIPKEELASSFRYVELVSGEEISVSDLAERDKENYQANLELLFARHPNARLFASENLTSGGIRRTQSVVFKFRGKPFDPGIAKGNCWKHSAMTDDGSDSGLDRLGAANRLFVGANQLRYKRYADDFGYSGVTNWWDEFGGATDPLYVVQTNSQVIKRCLLMTTSPGDLVLDPTCGSGTTAYVAEQWGRRWITCDTSRVPLALARQRLLTATFDFYQLKSPEMGPAGGFVYARKQNNRGEQMGGIVPHVTSSTVANNEPPKEEILVDRPEKNTSVTRVSGPFVVEATLPAAMPADGLLPSETPAESAAFEGRLLEVLRKVKTLRLPGNKTLECRNVRKPARSLSLSAEAVVDAAAMPDASLADVLETHHEQATGGLALSERRVAFVFGPENGAVSEHRITAAVKEANLKSYDLLVVIGFAIEPQARLFIERCRDIAGLPAFWVEATRDLMMGDLLKSMRSSQVFAVCGLPEIETLRQPDGNWRVKLKGLDVFDPITMESKSSGGLDVPAWFLDTDYNERIFHVTQAFFPRTKAWESLSKALRANYDGSVWEHLAGDTSAPFPAGPNARVAVKVIDDRGNELMVVAALSGKK